MCYGPPGEARPLSAGQYSRDDLLRHVDPWLDPPLEAPLPDTIFYTTEVINTCGLAHRPTSISQAKRSLAAERSSRVLQMQPYRKKHKGLLLLYATPRRQNLPSRAG